MPFQKTLDALGSWSILLSPDQHINRRTCTRLIPMQVLSLSAPRTGTLFHGLRPATPLHPLLTTSPPYVMNSLDADMWLEVMEAKYHPASNRPGFPRMDFDQLLGHVGATTDIPSILFWRELLAAYPEAKVVLVQRDEEKWLASIRVLLTAGLNPVGRYVLRYTDPNRTGRILNIGFAWFSNWFGVKQSEVTVEKLMGRARGVYRRQYADIRATVSRERLLEYELGTEWEPLCAFLGKEVPEVGCPHVNDARTLQVGLEVLILDGLKRSLVDVGMVVAGFLALWWVWELQR